MQIYELCHKIKSKQEKKFQFSFILYENHKVFRIKMNIYTVQKACYSNLCSN